MRSYVMATVPFSGTTLTVFVRLSFFSWEFIGRHRTTTCVQLTAAARSAAAGRAGGRVCPGSGAPLGRRRVIPP